MSTKSLPKGHHSVSWFAVQQFYPRDLCGLRGPRHDLGLVLLPPCDTLSFDLYPFSVGGTDWVPERDLLWEKPWMTLNTEPSHSHDVKIVPSGVTNTAMPLDIWWSRASIHTFLLSPFPEPGKGCVGDWLLSPPVTHPSGPSAVRVAPRTLQVQYIGVLAPTARKKEWRNRKKPYLR